MERNCKKFTVHTVTVFTLCFKIQIRGFQGGERFNYVQEFQEYWGKEEWEGCSQRQQTQGMYSRETNLGRSEEVRSMRRKGEMAYGFAQGKDEKQNFTHWKEEGRGKEVGQRLCLQVEET